MLIIQRDNESLRPTEAVSVLSTLQYPFRTKGTIVSVIRMFKCLRTGLENILEVL